MCMWVFNFQNIMGMRKGCVYQIFNYGTCKKNLQEYNLASQNEIYINKIQNKINYGWD